MFELAGRDHTGLLAAVLQLLAANCCDILSAAVWTFHDRVALVVAARDQNAAAISDTAKLQRLQQTLYNMMAGNHGDAVVEHETVQQYNYLGGGFSKAHLFQAASLI